ncbi:peptidoglycan-binding domain-containing protein [Solwaraspora sp. WMMA2101]|uniref:peptidoglycan-binding domain-containing protein n=1 Tax=Solwaraspora sp. WMMA2101 TaxID=3404124 RepID=UPI003B958F83
MRTALHRAGRMLVACAVVAATALAGVVATGSAAQADGCYTWGRVLSQGMSGEDVRQLQIRVSGYPDYGAVLALDGAYGPATRSAVVRFQQAYGLSADSGLVDGQPALLFLEVYDDVPTSLLNPDQGWYRIDPSGEPTPLPGNPVPVSLTQLARFADRP